ncbi:hypothetical protein RFF05_03605 [Bengtsoniella intestinalis]|uniref:hypothetical protein n=1 Tax=Bengtsoniella intestinalis TaxID=3073143 RepID=UPI00391FA309
MSETKRKLQCQIALQVLAKLQDAGLLSAEEVDKVSTLTRSHYAIRSVWELS